MTQTLRVYERHDASFGFYFEATEILEHRRSDFQELLVFDTPSQGRVFMLDGLTMLTEHTHHVYHEMMAHTPLSCVERCRDALIIGGGDGGVATELAKVAEIETITIAELDGAVVDVARQWFPEVAAGLNDPRARVMVGDGAAFVAEHVDAFDVIIIDSTDICEEALAEDAVSMDEIDADAAVASPLATDKFYADLIRALRPGGAVMQMLGSPTFYAQSFGALSQRLSGIWPQFKPVLAPTPFYITGDWGLGLYSVDGDLTPRRQPAPADSLRYFNLDVARGALALPNDVQALIAPLETEAAHD